MNIEANEDRLFSVLLFLCLTDGRDMRALFLSIGYPLLDAVTGSSLPQLRVHI